MFTFEDDDATSAAMDDVLRQFTDQAIEDEKSGTASELNELDVNDIPGLEDLGDGDRADQVDIDAVSATSARACS